MRRLLPLALILAAAPTFAQAVPDTTAPWRYYPLAVGNEWQYEISPGAGEPPSYERHVIVRDTTAEGQRYFAEAISRAAEGDSTWASPATRLLRYDSTTTRVMVRYEAGEFPLTCPLGAAFGSEVDCVEGIPSPNEEPEETGVVGGYGGEVSFGSGAELVPVTARKTFDPLFKIDAGSEHFAAPVGYLGADGGFCDGCFIAIRYAHVGGVEYGAPVVAAEPGPAPSALALAATPNPVVDALTLTLDLPGAGIVTAEAFDALGRRVEHREVVLGAGRQTLTLDAAGWRPGIYLVRVTMADGTAAAARVVRR